MRRDGDFFGERELELVFIAKKLKDALAVEDLFTGASLDYAIETDTYSGGVVFRTERVGAFFYVLPDVAAVARKILADNRFQAVEQPA